MCGIFGELGRGLDPAARDRFAVEADRALAHRGPDGAGVWRDDTCLLGHRRLAIIDLSTSAAQPMASSEGECVISFNGEIYNYVELRESMARPRKGWCSTSDTEVLLERLARGWADALDGVNGMFALALWRPREQRLLLARDRLGEKPLYYAFTPTGALRFASEIGALLADDVIPRTTTLDRLAEFLQHGYVAAPRTGFAEIHALPPGHVLDAQVGDRGITFRLRPYWSLPTRRRALPVRHDDWRAEFEATLDDAVKIRLRSDVPLGAFLSGGVDSSVVCLLAQSSLDSPLETFTVGYEKAEHSEGPYAEEVSKSIGSKHAEITLTESSVDELPKLVDIYGDLHGDVSDLPTVSVSRAMRSRVKVVLSGDGGDELLGGYTRYQLSMDSIRRASRIPDWSQRLARFTGRELIPSWVRGASRLSRTTDELDAFYALEVRQYASVAWPPPLRRSTSAEWHDPVVSALARHGERAPLVRLMATDAETYLPGDNLTKIDRASMAVGLEVRAPFLDHRLFELTMEAHPAWLADGRGTKRPLRDIYAPRLPPRVFTRTKMGFSAPVDDWLRGYGRAGELLLDRRAAVSEVLDRSQVGRMLGAYRLRLHKAAGRIWQLLILHAWFEKWHPRVLDA